MAVSEGAIVEEDVDDGDTLVDCPVVSGTSGMILAIDYIVC